MSYLDPLSYSPKIALAYAKTERVEPVRLIFWQVALYVSPIDSCIQFQARQQTINIDDSTGLNAISEEGYQQDN
jgi:hypothetical protein